MRVTNQYLFNNFKNDQQKVNQEIKKLTEQVASGKKIQNSYDDTTVYNDTLRLDTQIQQYQSIQDRTKKAKVFTTATDTALQSFDDSLRNINNKLLSAANATMNPDNREAIATELEQEKQHMMTLANTQIGGQYIFSGSATGVKPIDHEGHYQGNGDDIKTIVGEGVSITKNINGKLLFLGVDENVHKKLSTNVALKHFETGAHITGSDAIGDLTGDNTNEVKFQFSGTKHDGSIVKNEFTLNATENVDALLSKIGELYGNEDNGHQNVKVELNGNGDIEITDLKKGMSQLEFKLHGTQDGNEVVFNKSGYTFEAPGVDDSAQFTKEGADVTGNVALIANGKMADDTTKLSEIANGTLDTKDFTLNVTDIAGDSQDVTLSLATGGSTFKIGSDTYTIYDAQGNTTSADDMTLGQLNNVISMVTSKKLPTADTSEKYDEAVVAAKKLVDVHVNQSGKLQIHDKSDNQSKIEFAMYDTKAGDFSDTTASISFMSNNAVTTQKAQIDFFSELDDVIAAVRGGKVNIDSDTQNPRNLGMENSLNKIAQFSSHFNNQNAKIGVLEKSLSSAQDRAMGMEVNIKELKSDLTDVDIAETYMNLNQLSLNYQAILSSVTKVNSLTLLNYMK